MCWTHFNRVFLAFPWTLVATLRLLGGLAVSVLTMLSTEEALLDRDCSWGRLLVSSSIWKYRIMVHISPRTIDGRPSAISVALMLTNLIFLPSRNLSAVPMLATA